LNQSRDRGEIRDEQVGRKIERHLRYLRRDQQSGMTGSLEIADDLLVTDASIFVAKAGVIDLHEDIRKPFSISMVDLVGIVDSVDDP